MHAFGSQISLGCATTGCVPNPPHHSSMTSCRSQRRTPPAAPLSNDSSGGASGGHLRACTVCPEHAPVAQLAGFAPVRTPEPGKEKKRKERAPCPPREAPQPPPLRGSFARPARAGPARAVCKITHGIAVCAAALHSRLGLSEGMMSRAEHSTHSPWRMAPPNPPHPGPNAPPTLTRLGGGDRAIPLITPTARPRRRQARHRHGDTYHNAHKTPETRPLPQHTAAKHGKHNVESTNDSCEVAARAGAPLPRASAAEAHRKGHKHGRHSVTPETHRTYQSNNQSPPQSVNHPFPPS